MIQLEVTGDRELKARFGSFPERLRKNLFKVMTKDATDLVSHIKRDKLSGQVLKIQSGDLRDSIAQEVTEDTNRIEAKVFSGGNLPYAHIQEFGGKTAPHDIYPVNAQALFFQIAGANVFAKVVHHPGSVIPERSYMRSGLGDMRERIISDMENAAREAW